MLADVNQMAHAVEEDSIRLHPEDAISTKLWVDGLQQNNISIFHKSKLDQPLEGSALQAFLFILCIQTAFQLDAFQHLGNWFIGINVTHNTTQYGEIQLFTIIARDCWGHGM